MGHSVIREKKKRLAHCSVPAFPYANPSSLCSSSIYPYTSSSSPSPFVLARFFICLATPPTSCPSPSAASCPAVFAALSGPLSFHPAPRRLPGCPSVHPSVARCCYLPRHSCAHPALCPSSERARLPLPSLRPPAAGAIPGAAGLEGALRHPKAGAGQAVHQLPSFPGAAGPCPALRAPHRGF